MHHPKKQAPKADASFKAEQESAARGGLANATRIRVLQTIVEAVPVRLMKRDLLFVVGRLVGLLDEGRLSLVLRLPASVGGKTLRIVTQQTGFTPKIQA